MTLGPDQVLIGREAIGEWGRQIEEVTWLIRQVSTNMRFVSEGEDAVGGTTLVTAHMDEGEPLGTTLPWAIGQDHDRFVRTARGCRRWDQLFLHHERCKQ